MEVTFLGTGSSMGTPVIGCDCDVCRSNDKRDKRLRSSVLVQVQNTNIIIDASPDFRFQILNYTDIRHIDGVLITHEHRDHVAGLDDIRPFNFLLQKTSIDLYTEKHTFEAIQKLFFYSFEEDRYPGAPVFNINLISPENNFYVKDVKIIPIRVFHGKLPVLGFRIEDFTYITDAKYIPEKEIDKISGTKVLVVNALRRKEHYSHFCLSEAVDFINKIKPERAFITHMAHKLGKHADLERELPPNIRPAYDGLKITV